MPLYEDNGYEGLVKLWRAQSPVMRGALLMSLSTLGFAVMHASIRHVSATLPPFEIAFFRNVFDDRCSFSVTFSLGRLGHLYVAL